MDAIFLCDPCNFIRVDARVKHVRTRHGWNERRTIYIADISVRLIANNGKRISSKSVNLRIKHDPIHLLYSKDGIFRFCSCYRNISYHIKWKWTECFSCFPQWVSVAYTAVSFTAHLLYLDDTRSKRTFHKKNIYMYFFSLSNVYKISVFKWRVLLCDIAWCGCTWTGHYEVSCRV